MSKKLFSDEEIDILSKNEYVKSVSKRVITYTDDFKTLFIAEYEKGRTPTQIFFDAGFDIDVIGIDRIFNSSKRWRKLYKEFGELRLIDTRQFNSGKPSNRELSMEEIIAKKDAEIAFWKAEAELLKKIELRERQVKRNELKAATIFTLIQEIISKYNFKNMVSHLCKVAEVSRSGYYNYINSSDNRNIQEERDLQLKEVILKAFNYRGYKKGSRPIKMVLENVFNLVINRKCIQRIMRKYNIKSPIRKANPYRRMIKATKEHTVAPNLLNRNFKQGIPGKVLLTDITYLPYGTSCMAYLSTVKDASTNEILSYYLSTRLTIDIATETIEKLMIRHKDLIHKDAFIHSDQGAHYTSPKFQSVLKKYNLGQSMSRRGNCWDNAPQESFFGHMKGDIDSKNCSTFDELQLIIDDYIEYYNNFRYQWGLKRLTPTQYRNQLLIA